MGGRFGTIPPDLEAEILRRATVGSVTRLPAAPADDQPRRPPKVRDLVAPLHLPPATWVIPLYLPSAANQRGVQAGRAGQHRRAVSLALGPHLGALAPLAGHYHRGGSLAVSITRLGPGLLDDDNAVSAAKWVRDAVALLLGADDGSGGRIRWTVTQERGPLWGVRVAITEEVR